MPERRPIRFTVSELTEMARALRLISEQDGWAEVNMQRASVRAKVSASRKVDAMLARQRRPTRAAG